jgi:peptide/nickel transport system substrate-binding protein
MYLIGWSGDYADPDNFIGSLFKFPTKRFGAGGEHVQKILQEAASEPDHAKREALYVEANQKIMEWLPGVPLVNTKPYLALAASVQGYQASPVGYESFETVSVSTP